MALGQSLRGRSDRTRRRLRQLLTSPHDRALLRAKLGDGIWMPHTATVGSDRSLSLTGWAMLTDPAAEPVVLVNGRACESAQFGGESAHLRDIFPYHPAPDRLGFSARTGHAARGAFAEVTIADRASGRPIGDWQSVFIPLEGQTTQRPVPEAAKRTRVHGSADEYAFLLIGFSNVQKLDRALQTTAQRPLGSFRRMLDWGCGSGRHLRYLLDRPNVELTGADIDTDNLDWCRRNLPGATYIALDLRPPSALPSAAFDLVIGVSVFTHLAENVQIEWLAELARVTAPGGLVAASIHGPMTHAMTGSPAISNWIDRRLIVDGISHDLDAVVGTPGYYRTTFHTHKYVHAVWSRFFEILDILPACIGNVQDLVIMRRR